MINNTFQKISTIVEKLNSMPVKYKNYAGREFKTYYSTHEFLSKLVFDIGIDNNIEKDYRNLEDSCLSEMGFKYIATFIDKYTGESIAIFGI